MSIFGRRPDEYEARRQGERSQEWGEGNWSNPYRDSGRNDEIERAWDRGYRDAELRAEEEALERRRAERRAEEREREEYEMRVAAEQAEYEAAMEADLQAQQEREWQAQYELEAKQSAPG